MSELDFPTDGHVWLAQRQARRRDRVAPFTRRAHDPARGVRPRDRRAHRRRHGEPRALPLERDRRREGGVPDRARAGSALVPRRLPRDRHRAARPARRRLRRLRGGRPEVALRRSGSRVPVRAAGADPLARAGGDRVVRDGRAVLVRHGAPRVPPDRSALRARDAAGARLLHRAGRARHHQPRSRPNGSALARASSATISSLGRTSSGCRCAPHASGTRGAGSSTSASDPRPRKICHALLERDVCTDYRGDGLRISPHFFNTEEDVDRCFEELRTLL